MSSIRECREDQLHRVNLPEAGLCLVHQCLLQTSQLVEEILSEKPAWVGQHLWASPLLPGVQLRYKRTTGECKHELLCWRDFSTNSRRRWSLREGPGGTQSPRSPPLAWPAGLFSVLAQYGDPGGRAISQDCKGHWGERDAIALAAAVRCKRSRRNGNLPISPETLPDQDLNTQRRPAWTHRVFLYAPDGFLCPDQTLLCWHTFRMLI